MVMQFTVMVTWNSGTEQVDVNPDPVPAYQATRNGQQAQITWRASNGTFQSGAFTWKSGQPSPSWLPTESGGNLVSPVFDPQNEPNWFYNITITDSAGQPHMKDPEIENVPPTGEEEIEKPPRGDVGQPGGGNPGGGQPGGGGGGNSGGGSGEPQHR